MYLPSIKKSSHLPHILFAHWCVIFGHFAAWVTLALVAIQQSIVACTIFFLTEAIRRFEAGLAFKPFLYLYLVSMVVPYIPGVASFIYLQKWINRAHCAFVDALTTVMTGRINKYRDIALKEQINSVLARNSFAVLGDYIGFIHGLASFLLNSVLSLIVIGLLLPIHLLLGYIASLAICTIVITRLHQRITLRAVQVEKQHIQYSSLLDKGWDNLTLNNRYNSRLWHQQKTKVGGNFYVASNRLETIKQSSNLLLAMCSLLPTVFLVVAILQMRDMDAFMIAALMVSLTRIFLILNSLSALVHHAIDFISMTGKLKVLFDVGKSILSAKDTIEGTIKNIAVNQEPVQDFEQLQQVITQANCGRFTMTGANGSGKSTALLLLQKALAGKSFLLPTHYTDLIWQSNTNALSTGQRVRILIQEIAAIKKIQYLLLDEWDANLDAANTKAIDRKIDNISKTRVVIEVRHLG